jgi:TRAP-type C4-dicarboxylate transport system permease small subunit
MGLYEKIVRQLNTLGEVVSGLFLLGIMVLVVTNIFVRLLGGAIAGTYELVEMWIIVTASLAIGYTAFVNGHVVVNIVTAVLSNRKQTILSGMNSIICLFLWGVVAWMSILLAIKRGLGEDTDLLGISILPCRIIWIYGVIALASVYLLDLIYAFKGKARE